MERLTARAEDGRAYINDSEYLFVEDELWKAVDRLAELEDMIEQGNLVEVVRCSECKHKAERAVKIKGKRQPIIFCGRLGESPEGALLRVYPEDYCKHGERNERGGDRLSPNLHTKHNRTGL